MRCVPGAVTLQGISAPTWSLSRRVSLGRLACGRTDPYHYELQIWPTPGDGSQVGVADLRRAVVPLRAIQAGVY